METQYSLVVEEISLNGCKNPGILGFPFQKPNARDDFAAVMPTAIVLEDARKGSGEISHQANKAPAHDLHYPM